MEPDGIYNHRLKDLTRVEGTYEFRAVATFGEGCSATREAFWSIHVEPAIDPKRSDVHPRKRIGSAWRGGMAPSLSPLAIPTATRWAPGRGDRFTVSPAAGVKVTGPVQDRGDGGYGVSVAWDPSAERTHPAW